MCMREVPVGRLDRAGIRIYRVEDVGKDVGSVCGSVRRRRHVFNVSVRRYNYIKQIFLTTRSAVVSFLFYFVFAFDNATPAP